MLKQTKIKDDVNMTNASGVSTGKYAYTPFGKLLSSSTPVAGNPYTYTAREDDGTGLYYYRARYYDPSLEAFISQDPYGDELRYVNGNPILFRDPLGLESGTVSLGIYHPITKEQAKCSTECFEKQIGLTAVGSSLFISGQPVIPVPGKPQGATQGTSIASVTLRKLFPQKLPIPFPAPTLTNWGSRTANLGGFLGRATPLLGIGTLAVDAAFYSDCYAKCMDNGCGGQ